MLTSDPEYNGREGEEKGDLHHRMVVENKNIVICTKKDMTCNTMFDCFVDNNNNRDFLIL